MYFRKNLKPYWFYVSLYKTLFVVFVDKFVLMYPVNLNSDTFLYVSSDVFVQALVIFGVIKLSVSFVDVPNFVLNSNTGAFVRGFYKYVLSLLKLAYGLSFCSSEVVTIF